MKKIALISDTHSFLDPRIFGHLQGADEIWHAGDVGSEETLVRLEKLGKPFRAVYGNIDGGKVKVALKLWETWMCEDLKVSMTHIGGYPGRYNPEVAERLKREKPGLFIAGHSHILKVIYDKQLDLLHMNPGACGIQGIHRVQTLLLFNVNGKKMEDLRVVELPRIKRSAT